MGLFDPDFYQPSTGTAGLLAPSDKLMALFSGLSGAGMAMSMPGLSRSQALAMGLAGLGQGVAGSQRTVLQQRMLEQQMAEKQRKQKASEDLAKGFETGPEANPQLAALARIDPEAASKLAFANYGKAPEVVEAFDTNGNPVKMQWDRQTRQYVGLGGAKIDPEKLQRQPDGTYAYLPGVVPAQAGMEGAKAGAKEAATLPYAGPRAAAAAAAEAPFKAYSVPPGGTLATPFAGGLPPTAPRLPGVQTPQSQPPMRDPAADPRIIYQDPRPAPGTQPGQIEKYLGDRFIETQQAGVLARSKAQNLDRLEGLLEQAYTGTGADAVLAAQRAAKAMGFDLGNPAPGEAARGLSNEMALQLRNPAGGAGMPGAMSDADREFLRTMTPNLSVTPEGRKLMVETMRRVNQRDDEVARFAREYARDRGGKIDLNFEDELAKRFSAKPIFSDLAERASAIGKSQGVLDEAKAAIAKGAPRDAVIQRLKAAGIDTNGL